MNTEEWLEEINSSRKREKDWRKEGRDILNIYDNTENTAFNILYSNTETLSPALFSQVPRPVVQRRYKDDDPLGKAVSEASQRILEYLIDTDLEGYDNYKSSIQDAVIDGLLPGRGITTIKYESDDEVSWETACADSRKWDRVFFGYTHKWSKVPWIAYLEHLEKDEAKELFGDNVKHLKFTDNSEDNENEKDKEVDEEEQNQGKRKTAPVYQVWEKETKKIFYISEQYKEGTLREDDDPLDLVGFFNCPEPLHFIAKSNDLRPTAPYKLYENQAKELDKIQKRLNRVIEAIKVRGAYNGSLGDVIGEILKQDDTALLPTDTTALLMEGGFDKNIWLMPIRELMETAQALIQARESAKLVIYEIMGISDIVRGQSKASETLGAQKIKEAWGSMRIKRWQQEVHRYALDCMKLMLNVAINKFSEKSWAKMTGLPFTTTPQKEEAERMMEAMKQAVQQNPQLQQDPKAQQAFQKVQQTLQRPFWGDILKALKDDFDRSYRIDIETNSTLDVEATEDKALIGEFMNALAQMMSGFANDKTLPFAAKKSIILSVVKRYRFGREVEEELQSMQEPQPEQSPELQKAQKKLQQDQQKLQDEQKRAGEQLDQRANKLSVDEMQLDFDRKLAKMELENEAKLKETQQNVNEVQLQASLKEILIKHKSDVQSMLDKHEARVKHCEQD